MVRVIVLVVVLDVWLDDLDVVYREGGGGIVLIVGEEGLVKDVKSSLWGAMRDHEEAAIRLQDSLDLSQIEAGVIEVIFRTEDGIEES